MNNIAIIINALMEMYELSQTDFSTKTGIPLITVRKYLNSEFNPTKKNIDKIEKAFSVLLNEILEDLEDNNFSLNSLSQLEDLITQIKKEIFIYIEDLKRLKILNNCNLKELNEKEKKIPSQVKIESKSDIKNWLEFRNYDLKHSKKNLELFEYIYRKIQKNYKDLPTINGEIKIIIELLNKENNITEIKNNTVKIKNEDGVYKIDFLTFIKIVELLQNNLNDDFKEILKIISNQENKSK